MLHVVTIIFGTDEKTEVFPLEFIPWQAIPHGTNKGVNVEKLFTVLFVLVSALGVFGVIFAQQIFAAIRYSGV